jgi:hypothetical protein
VLRMSPCRDDGTGFGPCHVRSGGARPHEHAASGSRRSGARGPSEGPAWEVGNHGVAASLPVSFDDRPALEAFGRNFCFSLWVAGRGHAASALQHPPSSSTSMVGHLSGKGRCNVINGAHVIIYSKRRGERTEAFILDVPCLPVLGRLRVTGGSSSMSPPRPRSRCIPRMMPPPDTKYSFLMLRRPGDLGERPDCKGSSVREAASSAEPNAGVRLTAIRLPWSAVRSDSTEPRPSRRPYDL